MSTTETRIVGMLIAQLNALDGVKAWRQNRGKFCIKGKWVEFGISGQADITCVARGIAVFVEAKTEDGIQSPEQKQFQEDVEAVGALYILARTRDEAIGPVKILLAGGNVADARCWRSVS